MNERIKELAKEHFCRTEFDNGHVHECYEFSESELEKFAELIVKECAEVASDYDGAHYVGTAIEEHFGIEN